MKGVLFALVLMLVGTMTSATAQTSDHSEITVEVDLEARTVFVEELLRPPGGRAITAFLPLNAVDVGSSGQITNQHTHEDYIELTVNVGSEGTLSYALPSTLGRAAEGTRVNEAMIGFHIWPNLESTELLVKLPQGFVANVGPAFVPRLVDDETLEYSLEPVTRDEVWNFWFVAFRESGLERQIVNLENVDVEVAAWADDPDWMDFAVEHVAEGIPLLEEQIGLDWPRGDLRLIESVAPDQLGYGGWFDRAQTEIEIADSLDSSLFFHELAHAWFNDKLFADRWMMEGFAEEYAVSVGRARGDFVAAATIPGEPPEGFSGLAHWRNRTFFDDPWELEFYHYSTSFWVVHQLRAEVGDEAMSVVINDMYEGRHPYAIGSEQRKVGSNDWRRLLDTLELRAGSTNAESLFRRYVLNEDDYPVLDRRHQAMERYDELAAASEFDVPESIRVAMAEWDFADAERGMEQAHAALAEMAELEERSHQLGLSLPAHLYGQYRQSNSDFVLLEQDLGQTDRILTVLEADPDNIEFETARLYSLGRFDEIDVEEFEALRTSLNKDSESGSVLLWYLLAFLGLVVVLMIIAFIWASVVQRDLERPDEQAKGDQQPKGPIDDPPPPPSAGPESSMVGTVDPKSWP